MNKEFEKTKFPQKKFKKKTFFFTFRIEGLKLIHNLLFKIEKFKNRVTQKG